jgi:ribokinase
VVGHVEWVQFAHVVHVPRAGDIVHAHDSFEEPAGGGAVAAVQLTRLAGAASLFTVLGHDAHGERALERLSELGVSVHAERVPSPTRRAVTLLDDAGERTITTLGLRLEPHADGEGSGWEELRDFDGIYFTAGDVSALRAARAASRVLVASPRAGDALEHGVHLDALVLSADDPIERTVGARSERDATLVAMTEGQMGGSYSSPAGAGRWAATPVAEVADAYGCGDSFAAGLTYGLAVGMDAAEALHLGARCGAACLAGRGPYEGQLHRAEL